MDKRGPSFGENHSGKRPSVERVARGIRAEHKNPSVALQRQRKALGLQAAEIHNLNHQLEHDEQSGIFNKLGFMRATEETLHEHHTTEGSVIVIDLNHFKWINDTFGHHFGDVAIVKLALALEKNKRKDSDVVAHWHGDEFLAFAPEQNTLEDNQNELTTEQKRHERTTNLEAIKSKIENTYRESVLQAARDTNFKKVMIAKLEDHLSAKKYTFSDGRSTIIGPITFGVHRSTSLDEPGGIEQAITLADGVMYELKRARDFALSRNDIINVEVVKVADVADDAEAPHIAL